MDYLFMSLHENTWEYVSCLISVKIIMFSVLFLRYLRSRELNFCVLIVIRVRLFVNFVWMMNFRVYNTSVCYLIDDLIDYYCSYSEFCVNDKLCVRFCVDCDWLSIYPWFITSHSILFWLWLWVVAEGNLL